MSRQIKHMLDTIRDEARFTASYTGRETFDERVMAVMQEVDRELFVTERYKHHAYDNGPLPIGYGQTISQPYIVALMTDILELEPQHIVLEIGTGSGYQTAILSRLVKQVYSLERIKELAESSGKRLAELGYNNIELRCGDGYHGWQDKAPFDAIIVTAAATHIPSALDEQLKPGGRMIIPVGLPHMPQELMLVVKNDKGETEVEPVLAVSFVPLVAEDESEF